MTNLNRDSLRLISLMINLYKNDNFYNKIKVYTCNSLTKYKFYSKLAQDYFTIF